ncbi:ATP-dependent helicase [Haliscomenobacter hydrossis]|uniref:DNA 3'-5' helicase n=1 Tax=Haliscomenobacter hydrossis (strain ATCC 27775 / DSM 1100 / LMG 10767 / O) TaxID=760192 RepID=F4L0V2_HALH1|nr:ATP-dependent DNA helicase [Haliscomenobacter hydrossis]AEE50556.1 UvrD/REP helicase [Haliscomenobacter hydrossis DSM 1100]
MQYTESFLRELAKLNPAQRSAVEQIEGPVMVIAGPGTGKTHILAARIGKILLETDTQAQNILCLTFTDAGVTAMRERLLQLIGPDGHRVHIYTFHSFCNAVIQDNLELFGRQDLEPLGDLEKVDLIRALIDELDVEHPLKRGQSDVYFYETHLQDFFQRCKMEDWTAEYVIQQIDAWLASLPDRPEYRYQRKQGAQQKGDLKEAKIKEEQIRMQRLRAAAALYPRYEAAKQAARRYDYQDMILWVLRAFETHDYLLRSYQEQYLYVLVDEYQDTNGSQNEILLQLINYWETPNVFLVGDDDQSIFEFQGARLKNLTDFYAKYQHNLHTVVLTENYRSVQGFLDAAGQLIQNNQLRIISHLQALGLNKNLVAAAVKGKATPLISEYPNRISEETDIVQQIEALQQKGIPLQEIAIIYAQHRQVRNLLGLLEKKGIPYQTRRDVNILELPLIQRLRSLLDYLHHETLQPHSGELRLFQILHAHFLGISPLDLARLSTHLARFPADVRPPWRELLLDHAALGELNLEKPAVLTNFAILLEELIADCLNEPLPTLLEKLLNRSGFLQYILEQPNHAWQIQVLHTFFQYVREECQRRPHYSLAELLHNLHRMEANRLPLALSRLSDDQVGVHLLTAHAAKGLEFTAVFMLDCVKDYWEPASGRNSYRFTLPETLTYSGEEDATEARRRLFYVALTRAKTFLHLSYARQDDSEKELQRALYIDELLSTQTLALEQKVLPAPLVLSTQLLRLQEQQKPSVAPQDRSMIEAILRNFRMSISALNTFLNCPLAFYYEYILKVPGLHNEATAYGTAVHNALQRLFDRMLLSPQRLFPSEKELLYFFEQELNRQRQQLSLPSFERRLELGKRQLGRYYQYYYGRWHKRVRVEYTIRQIEVDGVPLTGTIDKIEFYDQLRVGIIDYKTGSHDGTKLRRPTDTNPYGGTYWRQLLFYKLLYEHFDRSSRRVTFGEIAYLDPTPDGQFPEVRLSFTPEDTAFMRQMIREAYAKIRKHEFYEGCGKANCAWCNFVKREGGVDRIERVVVGELDDRG